MMAIERRDLLDILDFPDSIADVTQDVAELVDQRGMHLPPALIEPFRALAKRRIEACTYAYLVICELDELVETGFGDREVALSPRRTSFLIWPVDASSVWNPDLVSRPCTGIRSCCGSQTSRILQNALVIVCVYWSLNNCFGWEDCCLMLLPNWNIAMTFNVMRVSVAAC